MKSQQCIRELQNDILVLQTRIRINLSVRESGRERGKKQREVSGLRDALAEAEAVALKSGAGLAELLGAERGETRTGQEDSAVERESYEEGAGGGELGGRDKGLGGEVQEAAGSERAAD